MHINTTKYYEYLLRAKFDYHSTYILIIKKAEKRKRKYTNKDNNILTKVKPSF